VRVARAIRPQRRESRPPQNDDERGYITAMTDLQRSGRALAALRLLLLLL